MDRVYYAFKTADGALFENENEARDHEYKYNIDFLNAFLINHPKGQRMNVINALRACADHLANMPERACDDI